ncbi:MAG: cyclopropane-fatty-acyl-phospholipid synthase family protein [Gammaproteobacteria bacterium]|nr:cyclopropane-fatty-acyl-phospholipid synthase family protein [Gammaproteobacteria bacterium]
MFLNRAINWVEQGYVPDTVTRIGIRSLVRSRAREEDKRYRDPATLERFLERMSAGPVAANAADANTQHYEVPTEFYRQVLGPRLKYSCGWFNEATDSLADAEENMLTLSAERAELADGMAILELGCGWGSMTLWMAERYPNATIVAVSNSSTQKAFIDEAAAARSLANIDVVTADMNDFDPGRRFDRIVSIEMFEHMRNHKVLFERISRWLEPDGKLFFHVFCHRHFPYFFEPRSDADWMAKNFFTGGMMPSFDLPLYSQSSLALEDRWAISGMHYARTCDRWLEQCDANRATVLAAFDAGDDPVPADVQFHRWRMFFMACRELFAFAGGDEWHVAHYRFTRQ